VTAAGFSGALIFRAEAAAGTYCLRGWPVGALPEARLVGLHRLLEFVQRQSGVPVAVPVAAVDGGTLVGERGRLWQLEPWLPGEADYWQRPSQEKLQNAMRVLADWHRTAFAFRCTDAESRWFAQRAQASSPAVAERLELVRRWQSGRLEQLKQKITVARTPFDVETIARMTLLFAQAGPFVQRGLESALSYRVPLNPCLRDIWHDHVLFSGDAVTGLIDPSACRAENRATDLARLLGSLVGDDRELWSMAIEEFARHIPLSTNELRLIEVLDQSSVLLSGMTWLDRIFLQQTTIDQPHRVAERLQSNLCRLETLVEKVRV
jgi:homoserine kinase type II